MALSLRNGGVGAHRSEIRRFPRQPQTPSDIPRATSRTSRPGKTYDLIVDTYCLHSVVLDEDRRRLFAAVRTRLKPRGQQETAGAVRVGDARYLPHRRHLKPDALARELGGAGFRIVWQGGEHGGDVICALQPGTRSFVSFRTQAPTSATTRLPGDVCGSSPSGKEGDLGRAQRVRVAHMVVPPTLEAKR